MKTTYTKNARRYTLSLKEVSKSALFIMYITGEGATWNKPLHPHSLPGASQLPPSPWGYEAKWQKSGDHLVSGDREMQGTESIVPLLSLRRDFQPGYVVVSWSSVVKIEPPHKRDKITILKFRI